MAGLLFMGGLLANLPAQAQKKSDAGSTTVKGEVVDMACYMAGEKKGPGHRQCASTCIKGGAPMGLLTSSGKLYVLVDDHGNKKPYEELKNYAADQVTVTGALHERNGVPGIVVSSVKKN